MSYLERINNMQFGKLDLDELQSIINELENDLGQDKMWRIIKDYFPASELLDILEYICTQENI